MTTIKIQTRKPPRTVAPIKSTQQETKETPFESKTTLTTEYIELHDRPGNFYYAYKEKAKKINYVFNKFCKKLKKC